MNNVVEDQFLNAEQKCVPPGEEFMVFIEPERGEYFAPKQISVACFRASGYLVSVPLERLPVKLVGASVRGENQMVTGGLIVGISDEELDADDDPPPKSPEDDTFIFRNLTPIQVKWAVFGMTSMARELQLRFVNICECLVHVFVRIDGDEMMSFYSSPRNMGYDPRGS